MANMQGKYVDVEYRHQQSELREMVDQMRECGGGGDGKEGFCGVN